MRSKLDSNMIQRIQTVYLAISVVLLMLPVFLNWNFATAGDYQLTAISVSQITDGVAENVMSSFPIAGTIMLSLFLTIYGIMQFKNRKFQIKLVQGALLVLLFAGGIIFFYADKISGLASDNTVSYSPTLAVLAASAILYFLALRGIKRDDELVRSADRLR